MQVILTRDVSGLGRKDDVKDVNDGYAKNFLLPRGFAITATTGSARAADERKAVRVQHQELDLKATQALARAIEHAEVEIIGKASPSGTLYAAKTIADVRTALAAHGVHLQGGRMKPEHLKEVGEHEVTVYLSHDLEATLRVSVLAEAAAGEKTSGARKRG